MSLHHATVTWALSLHQSNEELLQRNGNSDENSDEMQMRMQIRNH